jgi:hypothetical protein
LTCKDFGIFTDKKAGRLKKLCWSFQDLKLLLGSADMGMVSPGNLGYVSSITPTCQAEKFGLCMVRLGLSFLWVVGQKDPAYVMNHFVNVSSPECESLSTSLLLLPPCAVKYKGI